MQTRWARPRGVSPFVVDGRRAARAARFPRALGKPDRFGRGRCRRRYGSRTTRRDGLLPWGRACRGVLPQVTRPRRRERGAWRPRRLTLRVARGAVGGAGDAVLALPRATASDRLPTRTSPASRPPFAKLWRRAKSRAEGRTIARRLRRPQRRWGRRGTRRRAALLACWPSWESSCGWVRSFAWPPRGGTRQGTSRS